MCRDKMKTTTLSEDQKCSLAKKKCYFSENIKV